MYGINHHADGANAVTPHPTHPPMIYGIELPVRSIHIPQSSFITGGSTWYIHASIYPFFPVAKYPAQNIYRKRNVPSGRTHVCDKTQELLPALSFIFARRRLRRRINLCVCFSIPLVLWCFYFPIPYTVSYCSITQKSPNFVFFFVQMLFFYLFCSSSFFLIRTISPSSGLHMSI